MSLPRITEVLDNNMPETGKNYYIKGSTNLATPPTLTTGVAAWETGTAADIIPVNSITKNFIIERVNIGAVSTKDTYQLFLYANDIQFYTQRFIKDTGFGVFFWVDVMSRIFAPNTKISAAIACSGGASATCTISLTYN